MSDPLAEPRPAERLAIEPIVWLTTAGADGQPQSSPVWFHWDGSAFWLRTQVAARKVTNMRANPKVALHLADDGNGGDIVTVEGTAELRDGWSDDVESAFLAKYDEAIRTAIGTTFEQFADRLPGNHSRPPDSDEDLVTACPTVRVGTLSVPALGASRRLERRCRQSWRS